MKNIRFYTIAVLFGKLPTPKVNCCLHMNIIFNIWYRKSQDKLSSRICEKLCFDYLYFG